MLWNAEQSSFRLEDETEDEDGTCPLCGSTNRPQARTRHRSPTLNRVPALSYFHLLESSSRAPSRPATPPGADDLSDALSDGYYARFFIEERLLGRGQRGAVYLCHHVLHGEKLSTHAVKKTAVGQSASTLLTTLKEVRHLSRLKHANIVSYQHSWLEMAAVSDFGPRVPTLYILLELANGGSLATFIEQRLSARLEREESSASLSKGERLRARRRMQQTGAIHHIRVDEILSLFEDIVEGLAFLHDAGVVHADLKAENVLLRYEESTTPRALLSDFGSSRSSFSSPDRTGATGTLDWLPPETLRIDPRTGKPGELTAQVDLWAAGLLLHLLCYLKLPWSVSEVDALREEIVGFPGFDALRPPLRRSDLPRHLLELMASLLSLDPSRRPKATVVLARLRPEPTDEKAALVPARPRPSPSPTISLPLDRLAFVAAIMLKALASSRLCLLSPIGVNILLVTSLVEILMCACIRRAS